MNEDKPPLYDSLNGDIEIQSNNYNLESGEYNSDDEVPAYNDEEAERFLEHTISKKKLCSEKIYQTLFITLFLLVNIIFFSFIIKPNFSDTCARYNSTCFSRYVCDNYNRCYYKNTCYDCNSFTTWTFVIIIANCLPTTIIFYCIIKLFNRITNYNY